LGEAQRILTNWFIDSLQAVVDTVGSEETVRLHAKQMEITGHAGILVALQYLGLEGRDEVEAIRAFSTAHQGMGKGGCTIEAGQGHARVTFSECPFERSPPEICQIFCFYPAKGAVRGILPVCDVAIVKSRRGGDADCAKHIFPVGQEALVWQVVMEPLPPNPPMTEEYMEYVGKAYAGEFFMNVVRSCVASPRRDELFAVMSKAMRARGLEEGLALTGNANEKIAHLMSTIGMKGAGTPEGISVSDCPFSHAPPEACSLVGSFWQGVAASSGSEVEYAASMTQGDAACLLCLDKDRPRL
jgi:hypothetical protein